MRNRSLTALALLAWALALAVNAAPGPAPPAVPPPKAAADAGPLVDRVEHDLAAGTPVLLAGASLGELEHFLLEPPPDLPAAARERFRPLAARLALASRDLPAEPALRCRTAGALLLLATRIGEQPPTELPTTLAGA